MKNNQKNAISKAEINKPRRKTPEELFNRTPEERRISYTRRWSKTKIKEIHKLNEIFPGRNSISFSISISKTHSNNSLAYKEEEVLTNMPACGVINYQKGESRGQKYKISDTLTIEVSHLGEFPDMESYNPPKVASSPPKNKKFVRYHGINKPFSEFTPLDWHNWHRNKAAYHGDTLTREYAKKRVLVLDLPPGIMGARGRSLDSPKSMPRLPLSERNAYSSASSGVPISAMFDKLRGLGNGVL